MVKSSDLYWITIFILFLWKEKKEKRDGKRKEKWSK